MKMAKHNKNLGPRRKRMKRTQRLKAAEKFFRVYNGKNIVRGYSRYFGVSLLCAALELKMLGCNISDELIERYRLEEQRKAEARRRKKERTEEFFWEHDHFYAFIAGYTPGGFAYGITWEEWEQLEKQAVEEKAEISEEKEAVYEKLLKEDEIPI